MKLFFILLALGSTLIKAQYQNGYNINPYSKSSTYENGDQNYESVSSRSSVIPKQKLLVNQKNQKKIISKEDEEKEEEEKKPSLLELLLANSKFSCSNKKDGYYADSSVNCQVFHYCVGGAKHSWMCPEGTVFHQVHLNCVPAAQDICSQSEKYHIVNEYLHKPIENNYGPNQTIRYHQRYYPDEFLGDSLVPPSINVQSYSSGVSSYQSSAPRKPTYSSNTYDDYSTTSIRSNNKPSNYYLSNFASSYPSSTSSSLYKLKSVSNLNNYPTNLLNSPQSATRKQAFSYNVQSNENYETNQPASISRNQQISNYQSVKPSSTFKPFQAYSGAAPVSNYKQSLFKSTGYNSYNSASNTHASAGYDSSNSKPYDYSGVTYEEDY